MMIEHNLPREGISKKYTSKLFNKYHDSVPFVKDLSDAIKTIAHFLH